MNRRVSTAYQSDPASLEAAIEEALRTEKQRIADEIRRYPHPIPACDDQFNYLIEQRDRVKQELSHLHAISYNSSIDEVELKRFIATSTMLDSDTKEHWLSL